MDPTVSIIIPCYNQAHYLPYALDSILAQTFANWEAIIIDDGSTDDTAAVAARFTDPRIHYIYQDNQGLAGARNTGIKAAKADIIALLDSDDLWLPEFLEKMVDHLNHYPYAAAVYCGFRYIDTQGVIVGKQINRRIVPPENFYQTLISEGNWLVPCAVIFRKHLAESVGLFDESLRALEDTDLWIRLAADHVFVGLPQALVKYRRHDANMTNDPKHMLTAYHQLVEKMYGPPKGEVISWPESKKLAYAKLFRTGASRYLAYGNVQESACYFQQLVEHSPSFALSMGVWRALARVHLFVEYRNDPEARLDWTLAYRDISKLLNELAIRAKTSKTLKKYYTRLKGSAFLALADEAVRGDELSKAYSWLLRTMASSPALLLSRPYWGIVVRSVTGAGWQLSVSDLKEEW